MSIKTFGPDPQPFKPLAEPVLFSSFPVKPVVSVGNYEPVVVIDDLTRAEKSNLWAAINKKRPGLASAMKASAVAELKQLFGASHILPLRDYNWFLEAKS